ncbi:MAG: sugar ABC transporter permease [Clostridia bacterium]|nr:sugar ABC transporter permease [Clostridia bacterium]
MKKINKLQAKETATGFLFCSPYILYFLVLFLIPLLWAFWLSTLDWNLMSPDRKFVDIQNFLRAFKDKEVIAAFKNSWKYFVCVVSFSLIGGLIIALLVNRLPMKIRGVGSVLFFIPYLTSGVAVSVLTKYLFSYNSILNTFLREKLDLNINWFIDGKSAFAVIIIMIVWKLSGYYALYLTAAIQSISKDVQEAALLDGSTGAHRFFHVTLPMILPTIATILTLATGTSFGVYTEPFLLTEGGPANMTTTWTLEIYYRAFTRFESGYGTAMAILFALQIFLTVKILNAVMDRLHRRYGC